MVDYGINGDRELGDDVAADLDWIGFDPDSIRRPGVELHFNQSLEQYLQDAFADPDLQETEQDLYGDEEVEVMNVSSSFAFYCFPDDRKDAAETFTDAYLTAVDRQL